MEHQSSNAAFGLAALAAMRRREQRVAEAAAELPKEDKADPHAAHPYFHYYGLLVHQQNMLQDHVRTATYHDAIMKNATDFFGKTVLDVGTGSGILAYFAAKAGAVRVYAVEASDVADRAALLLQANGLADRIVVIKQKVELVELPGDERVDIIISEPMGFMLLHEQMLKSYMIARERFLRPGGRMFPSTGTIIAAPFTDAGLWAEQAGKVAFWQNHDFYGLDLRVLAPAAAADHFSQPVVGYVDPTSLLSEGTASLTIDFEKDDPSSLDELVLPFEFRVTKTGICHGLAAWFTVDFNGSDNVVTLSTGPTSPGTHWYQCRLLLPEPLAVNARQTLQGSMRMVANKSYSYDLHLRMSVRESARTTVDGTPVEAEARVSLGDQFYSQRPLVA